MTLDEAEYILDRFDLYAATLSSMCRGVAALLRNELASSVQVLVLEEEGTSRATIHPAAPAAKGVHE